MNFSLFLEVLSFFADDTSNDTSSLHGFLPTLSNDAKLLQVGLFKFILPVIFLSIIGFSYWCQKKIIYMTDFPSDSRTNVARPIDYDMNSQEHYLDSTDNVKLHAYLMFQDDISESPTIIFFRGNYGNIGHSLREAKLFYQNLHCNVLLVSYRGFGKSTGDPEQKGIQEDAETALKFLLSFPDIDSQNIAVYGHSLGGAIAASLCAKYSDTIKLLILVNTYFCSTSVICQRFPCMGPFLSFFCKETWETCQFIPQIQCPTLFLCGENDKETLEDMRKLYNLSRAPGKSLMIMKDVDHDHVFQPKYSNAMASISDFWNRIMH